MPPPLADRASPLLGCVALVGTTALAEIIASSRLSFVPIAALLGLANFAVYLWTFAALGSPDVDPMLCPRLAVVALAGSILVSPAAMAMPSIFFSARGYAIDIRLVAALGALALITAVLTLLLDRPGSAAALWCRIGALAPLAIALRVAAIASYPLDPDVADMLPAIRVAADRLLAGTVPYAPIDLGAHTVPVAYLPGMWLPYVPLVALGLDLRWLNVGALLVVSGLLAALGAHCRAASGVTALVGLFLFNPVLVARGDLYTGPAWLVIALAAVLLARAPRWTGLVMGLGAATQQIALVAIPGAVGYLVRRLGRRPAAASLAAGALLALLAVAPFVVAAPDAFVYGIWGQYRRPEALELSATRVVGLDVRPLMGLVGLDRLALAAQVGATAAVGLLGMLRSRHPADALRWTGLATATFLLFNYPSWSYLWVQAWLWLAFALLLRGGAQASSRGEPRLSR